MPNVPRVKANSRPVWRISCGQRGQREYVDVFRELDVALLGWGDYGQWSAEAYDGFEHPNDYGSLKAFATEIEAGHIVLATFEPDLRWGPHPRRFELDRGMTSALA